MSQSNNAREAQQNKIPEHAHQVASVAHEKSEQLTSHEQTLREKEQKREEKQK